MHPNVVLFAEVERRYPGSTTVVTSRDLRTPVDSGRLDAALEGALDRHRVLAHGLVQHHEHDATSPASWWTSYRAEPRARSRAAVERNADGDARRIAPVALDGPGLFRFEIVSGERDNLRLVTPHAIADWLSHDIFWADFARLYRGEELAPAPTSFVDHAASQEAAWREGALRPALAFWRSHYATVSPQPFPQPRERLTIWPLRKASSIELSADELAVLGRLQMLQATPFGTAVGLFALAERDVLGWSAPGFMTPVANRRSRATLEMFGLLTNVVHFHAPLDGRRPTEVLEATSSALFATFAHGHYPFDLLQAEVDGMTDTLGAGPIVAVRQPNPRGRARRPSASDEVFAPREEPEEIGAADHYGLETDLLFDFIATPGSTVVRLTYRADRLHGDTVADLLEAFRSHLRELATAV